MSWIFISTDRGRQRKPSGIHDVPLHTVVQPGLYLALGGIPETSFCETSDDSCSGWAVLGTGISHSDGCARILTKPEWRHLLAETHPDVATIDGSFVAIRWRTRTIECFTDQLGLRTIYFAQSDGGLYVSTRLDWISQATGHRELSLEALGSKWLLFNQVGHDSCITGIQRLGPGGHASFDGERIQCTDRPWLPEIGESSSDNALNILQSLVLLVPPNDAIPSLGLSGGVDSRLVLSLLHRHRPDGFTTHTFGESNDPDVQIAAAMASTLALPHHMINEPLPEIESCISALRSFAAQTILIEPVSAWTKLRYYPRLREHGSFLLDGGFGELARRKYLNRLLIFGRRALRVHDIRRIMALMRMERADFFVPDVNAAMEQGALESLERAIDAIPSVETIGYENFVDLLAIRTRVPNYGGPEQGRLDAEALHVMPLVQPSFLRAMMNIPVALRRNGLLYRRWIHLFYPALEQFRLAGGGITYPYRLAGMFTTPFIRLKAKLGCTYNCRMEDNMLGHLREFVLDVSHSQQVLTNPLYDSVKLQSVVERYYKGKNHLHTLVDWWLTFELWWSSLNAPADAQSRHADPRSLSLWG